MIEQLKSEIPINILPSRIDLPTLEADILHALSIIKIDYWNTKKRDWIVPHFKIKRELFHRKSVNYYLDPLYKWVKIPPYVLYKLQSEKPIYYIKTNSRDKNLKIINGKLILTDCTSMIDNKEYRWTIKSCIDNPLKLENPNQNPENTKYLSYNGSDYFILPFKRIPYKEKSSADIILVQYTPWLWLQIIDKMRITNIPIEELEFDIDSGTPKIKR